MFVVTVGQAVSSLCVKEPLRQKNVPRTLFIEDLVSWHHANVRIAPRDVMLPMVTKTDLAALRRQVQRPCATGSAPVVRQV